MKKKQYLWLKTLIIAVFNYGLFTVVVPLIDNGGNVLMIPHTKNYKIKLIIFIPYAILTGYMYQKSVKR
ncbi:hypothetical protein CLTEP_18130 [Clostridium tepidiprofundi DSM 19306]|uniref:Uncharacterized protein n=1 Tax=Clostridium tepidiprofundi DSM 19306 TaxID=1121338 RepID=A0A151B2U7_9CLOT|nr:hypothetical protein [Clostridium tepidiprofundi]KYH34238.1 hypothetical protein CLTEP_18130 [Clostridium tepidiprofundi DSM 19306]